MDADLARIARDVAPILVLGAIANGVAITFAPLATALVLVAAVMFAYEAGRRAR